MGKGEVLGLYPLMPDRMKVDRDEEDRYIMNILSVMGMHPLLNKERQ